MLDEFYVGDIDTATISSKTTYTPPKQPHYNQDKTKEFVIKMLQFLVPVIFLCVAVGIRFYAKPAEWSKRYTKRHPFTRDSIFLVETNWNPIWTI